MNENILFAFSLTLMAGLATGIGSTMVLLTKRTNYKLLAFSLGLSAGVMLYVSFVEILAKSVDALVPIYGEKMGNTLAVCGFFVGIIVIALIDKCLPNVGNPHEIHTVEEMDSLEVRECATPADTHKIGDKKKKELMRMGLFTALAIGIHNFPEGLATFISAIEDPDMGIAIAVAIAIHNIPEGIAVAMPIFYATGSRMKAFKLSFLSGLSEPIGALIGYFLFLQFFGNEAFGFIFAAVAGIMVYISLDELLPASKEYGDHHVSMWGLIIGMAIMALSLLLFL